jgi:integrase
MATIQDRWHRKNRETGKLERTALYGTGKRYRPGPDDLVFPSAAQTPLRVQSFRRWHFDRAAVAAGLDGLVPHELRHTAASLAIASGASIKGVQSMLGHASAAMTLDRYGHLFGDELDAVADRMDAARADWLRTEGGLASVRRLHRAVRRVADLHVLRWPRQDSNLRHTV